jgi:hypothetical protein
MSQRERSTHRRRVLIVAAAAGLAAAAVAASAASATAATGTKLAAKASYPVVSNIGPRFTVAGGASVLPTTQTVPHWHGSFTDGLNGQTYGFNMVGTDPSTTSSTTVSTEIIPLNFSFAADKGLGFSGGQVASWAAESPIFQPTALPSGETTQYLDAVMRSEFNKIGSGYHVLLSTSTLAAQTISVPQNQGALFQLANGTVLGLVNSSWFSAQLQSILASSHVSPTTLPIVISNNVYLYIKSISNCCIIGFHGAGHPTGLGAGSTHGNGNQPVPTFAWASWIPTPDIFGAGLTDVAALSHEISEWGHDPFVNNFVNPWEVAGEPQYGCSNVLETGDPLVGVDFPAGTTNPDPGTGPAWHLQDEAFLWWFARQPLKPPTPASNHEYSYDGTFTTPAATCS